MAEALSPEKCERIRRLCATYSGVEVCRIAKISSETLWALKKRDFAPRTIGRQRRPLPADFAVLANRMNYDELSRHYHVGGPTLRSWFKLVDRQYRPDRVYPKKAMPSRAEVMAVLARMTVIEAQKHFGIGETLFLKWRRILGVPIGGKIRLFPGQTVEPKYGWGSARSGKVAA